VNLLSTITAFLGAGLLVFGSVAPAENTIDEIAPDHGAMTEGGSTEATLFVTSGPGCLEADSDPGLDVTFDPRCGEGNWTATMFVNDNGDEKPTGEVLIRLIADGSEVDSRVWEIQMLTFLPGPGPTTTTTTVTSTTSAPPPPTSPVAPPPSEGDAGSPEPESPDEGAPPPSLTPDEGAPPPSPIPDEEAIAAEFLEAGMAFNTPDTLGLNETTTLQLLIGPDSPGSELKTSITGPDEVEATEIDTTCETTARLQGQNFEVLDLTEPTQFICAGTAAQWLWQVTALEPGRHSLTLTITALLEDNPPVTIRVFQRDIQIQVGFWARILGLIGDNVGASVGAFMTALGTAAAAWALSLRRKRNSRRRPPRPAAQ
jgi:hypothetical protein